MHAHHLNPLELLLDTTIHARSWCLCALHAEPSQPIQPNADRRLRNLVPSDAILTTEGLKRIDVVPYWVFVRRLLAIAKGPPSLLLLLASFLEAFDLGHEHVFLFLGALNAWDAVLYNKRFENSDFVACWVVILTLLLFAERPPGLLLLFTRALEGLDLIDELLFNKMFRLGALNALDSMISEEGLENVLLVQCWVSLLAFLTITESPPGLLIFFTGALEFLDLVDEFVLHKTASTAPASFASFAPAPALAPAPASVHAPTFQEGHHDGGSHLASAFVAAFHHGSSNNATASNR